MESKMGISKARVGIASAFITATMGILGFSIVSDEKAQALKSSDRAAQSYANETVKMIEENPNAALQPIIVEVPKGHKVKIEFDKVVPVTLENQYPKHEKYLCKAVQVDRRVYSRIGASDTALSRPFDCKPFA